MTRQLRYPVQHLSLTPYNRMAVDIYHHIKKGQILLDPPYQRGSVWTTDQRLDLMYSFLSGYPIGAVILNDRLRARWGHEAAATRLVYAVIDGRQRLETIVAWFDGRLTLPSSWIERSMIKPGRVLAAFGDDDGDGVDLNDLTDRGAAEIEVRMALATVVAHVDNLAGEAEIYRLVNAGGTPHTTDDLNRAAQVEKES